MSDTANKPFKTLEWLSPLVVDIGGKNYCCPRSLVQNEF